MPWISSVDWVETKASISTFHKFLFFLLRWLFNPFWNIWSPQNQRLVLFLIRGSKFSIICTLSNMVDMSSINLKISLLFITSLFATTHGMFCYIYPCFYLQPPYFTVPKQSFYVYPTYAHQKPIVPIIIYVNKLLDQPSIDRSLDVIILWAPCIRLGMQYASTKLLFGILKAFHPCPFKQRVTCNK